MTIPKFRAWLKDEQRMIESYDTLAIDYENEEIVTQKIYSERGLAIERDIHSYDFDDVNLMQSTGLFDKNGKEIFESDIVKVLNSLYTVFYDSERGSFRLKPRDERWHTDYMSNFSGGGNFEIIGNIYENPEFLDGEK